MPGLRGWLIALGVGLGVGAFLVLWWRWPLAIGGGAAILLAGLALVGTTSVGSDGADADAAWRAAAPEFTPVASEPGVPVHRVPEDEAPDA
ncbi:MAG: hypothetical protein HYX57_10225 [Chloroflexi bacterium]|nr:hypothetical protein [Chloroflexota bacterium]